MTFYRIICQIAVYYRAVCKNAISYCASCTIGIYLAYCTIGSCYLTNCTIGYCYLANCMMRNFCVWVRVGTFTNKTDNVKTFVNSSKCGKNLWHIGATVVSHDRAKITHASNLGLTFALL